MNFLPLRGCFGRLSCCNDILLKDIDVVAKRGFSDVVESPII